MNLQLIQGFHCSAGATGFVRQVKHFEQTEVLYKKNSL